ncbi:MAG: DUF6044 family protein [Acetatifactor sp.]
MNEKKKCLRLLNKLNHLVYTLDNLPLWWVGLIMLAIIMLPHLTLGRGSVFPVHDQLDESMMNYVLTARHLGESFYPEMMNGIDAGGLQPAALLFLPLYRLFSPFTAFMICYVICFVCGFTGMYLAVRELTESSILAVISAGCFSMLPLYPIYGLTEVGIPLVFYAFLCLLQKKKTIAAFLIIAFFGLSSSLVYLGYAVLGFWLLAIVILFFRKKDIKLIGIGFLELLFLYIFTNIRLFADFFFGSGFVSHREEMLNSATPFGSSVFDIFVNGHYHAYAAHTLLIIPIVVLLIIYGLCYRKMNSGSRRRYLMALVGLAVLIAIALFYGFCRLEFVVEWKNRVTGFLHFFQIDRFYWLYPAGWYLELALVLSVGWTEGRRRTGSFPGLLLQVLVIAAIVYPTADVILEKSFFYQNVNQYNNGSEITEYISWESFYAEDVMQEIDRTIRRDKSTYKVAHLGISPAPALMYGFYTVDGYSNNYALEYKHSFRKVIATELEKDPASAVYFDTWGNRCYLFNSVTGSQWMLKKGSNIQYEGLEFDMDALAELGCEYLFAGAEVRDAESMGLEYLGYYESETSYWGIWLYALPDSNQT